MCVFQDQSESRLTLEPIAVANLLAYVPANTVGDDKLCDRDHRGLICDTVLVAYVQSLFQLHFLRLVRSCCGFRRVPCPTKRCT